MGLPIAEYIGGGSLILCEIESIARVNVVAPIAGADICHAGPGVTAGRGHEPIAGGYVGAAETPCEIDRLHIRVGQPGSDMDPKISSHNIAHKGPISPR